VRVALAVLVMWWVFNLIFAMVNHDYPGIILGVLYLSSCAFGCLVRGWIPGLAWWIASGTGIYVLMMRGGEALALGMILFWCAVALVAGNLFRTE